MVLLLPEKNYTVMCIENHFGEMVDGDDMATVFLDYFKGMFSSVKSCYMDQIYNIVGKKISNDINNSLSWDFTVDEIKVAMQQMSLGKSLGPDRMTTSFYKKYCMLLVRM